MLKTPLNHLINNLSHWVQSEKISVSDIIVMLDEMLDAEEAIIRRAFEDGKNTATEPKTGKEYWEQLQHLHL